MTAATMLDREKLVSLFRDYRDRMVLSVFIDADQHDPAQRGAWRVPLKQGLSTERRKLEAADGGGRATEALDQAYDHVRSALGVSDDAFLPGRGWVGYATADGLLHAESLAVPVPDLVRWGEGVRIARYIRALKQLRPVFVVLVDRRKAAIYRYRQGTLEELEERHADTYVGDLTDIGTAKRATKRSGVRGKTGTDAAEAILDKATERMLGDLADRLRTLADQDDEGFFVLGGIAGQISALEAELADAWSHRRVARPSLNFDSSESELTEAVERAASELTSGLHAELLDDVVRWSHLEDGPGRLGPKAVIRALRAQRVRALLVTSRFIETSPDRADVLVGTALDSNGAEVHVPSGEAAERLDREADGVAAALHY